MTTDKREQGKEGEDKATSILKAKGYKIIERNYRNPFGEIDIVAEEGGYLVFIEVKKRNTETFGDPLHAIDEAKKRHIIKSAQYYLKSHKLNNKKARFDVVGITKDNIKIVKNAFLVEYF
ncbi:MAG TPA: YraN family protein [Syntrophorhabdaceae bacterium]|nr:YraN family protein [Syntrophorhabdaceae bacterium]HPU29650.1 YraN family protein [Syntrophorhabdaceae bacterium]